MKSNCMPRVFGPACLYAQVIKTRRNDRIGKVERRPVIGAAWRFDEALLESEDSSTLNTAFVERLNLTTGQASAYLTRRTTCHARCVQQLENQLEMVRCHYNFLRLSQSAQVRRRDKDDGDAGWAGASTTRVP
jgi:hypothetical protein